MAKKSTQLDKTICKFNSIYAERRLKKQIDLIEKDRKQVLLKIEREQILLKKELKDQRRQKMSRVFPEPPDGVDEDETPGRKTSKQKNNKSKKKVTIGDDVHEIDDDEFHGVFNSNGLLTAPGINRGGRRLLSNDSDEDSSHDGDDSDEEVLGRSQSRIRFVDIPTATLESPNESEIDSPYTMSGYGSWADRVSHLNRSNSVQLPAAPRHAPFTGRPTTSSGAVNTPTTRSLSNLSQYRSQQQTPLGRSTPMGGKGAAAVSRRPGSTPARNGPLYGNSRPPRYSVIKKQIEEEEHETVMRMRKIYQQRENEEVDNKVMCFLGKGVRKKSMPPITTAEEAEILEKIGSLVREVDRRRKMSIVPGAEDSRKTSTTSN